jgi:TctA family transporter
MHSTHSHKQEYHQLLAVGFGYLLAIITRFLYSGVYTIHDEYFRIGTYIIFCMVIWTAACHMRVLPITFYTVLYFLFTLFDFFLQRIFTVFLDIVKIKVSPPPPPPKKI